MVYENAHGISCDDQSMSETDLEWFWAHLYALVLEL